MRDTRNIIGAKERRHTHNLTTNNPSHHPIASQEERRSKFSKRGKRKKEKLKRTFVLNVLTVYVHITNVNCTLRSTAIRNISPYQSAVSDD